MAKYLTFTIARKYCLDVGGSLNCGGLLDSIQRETQYHDDLIRSFRDKNTEAIFSQRYVRKFQQIAGVALRKLVQIDSAEELRDLASPPANRLKALKGGRVGECSIRINDQYRICFRWRIGHAFDVEITDYH